MSVEVFRPRREVNKFPKKGKPRDIKVGILIPLPYRAAASSLIMHLFYEYINSLEDAVAYRFVYNVEEDVIESLDQDISLRQLDLVLVSASFELDYITISRILSSLKLLPKQKGRSKPIIVIGGLAPTSNPLPLSSIADAVVVGEAEEVIDTIVYASREENPLELLKEIKCVDVPPFDKKIRRCVSENLDAAYHPVRQVYSVDEEPVFGHGIRVELSRGCPYLCSFCMEAHILYPFRYRSYGLIQKVIDKSLSFNALAKKVIMYSLSFFSIPYTDNLLSKLLAEGISASIPSLRVEHVDSKRLEVMRSLGQKTLTIAPETLVNNYGCKIGKCSDVSKVAEIILDAYRIGYEHVKLYLMTGFPQLDIDEEINALRELLKIIVKDVKKRNFVEVSLNILIPKPWTPFQYLPPGYVIENSGKIEKYRELAKEFKILSMDIMDPKWGFIQAVISQGDERISEIIVECSADKCTPTKFIKLVNSYTDKLDYVHRGWGEEPPWLRIVDIGFNVKYLEYRFKYLAKFNK